MDKERIEWDPESFLTHVVKSEMKENKDLSYGEAFSEAQKKYPEMARRYSLQVRGLWPPK